MNNKFRDNFKKNNPNEECPENLGLKWSINEENELIDSLREEKTIEEIARIHKRTIGGIKSRINIIVYKLLINGKSVEYINKNMNITKEEIEDIKLENELKIMN